MRKLLVFCLLFVAVFAQSNEDLANDFDDGDFIDVEIDPNEGDYINEEIDTDDGDVPVDDDFVGPNDTPQNNPQEQFEQSRIDRNANVPKGKEFFGVKSSICSEEERASCPEYRQLEYMLQKGCKPVYRKNKCCAVRYKCVRNFKNKLRRRCWRFGRFYNDGAPMPSPDPTCSVNCFCDAPRTSCNTIACGIAAFPQQPGCYFTFSRDECCFGPYVCANATTPTCTYRGNKVYEGQFLNFSRIALPDSCRDCICTKDYAGPFGPECKKRECRYSFDERNPVYFDCVPIFSGNACCSYDYHLCPNNDVVIQNQGRRRGGKNKCKFGNIFLKRGEKLRLTDPRVECQCLTPPELLCVGLSESFLERYRRPNAFSSQAGQLE